MATQTASDSSTLKVLRVFLASPSDLADERRTARAAVDEINKTVARPAGFHVDLIGWEDTLSSAGRPQALINEDLESCQMFIGMLWARWGTPPDTSGRFTSGFEEEFTLACSRHLKTGEPHITLFFKDVERSKLDDAGPELSKVLAFKSRVIAEKKVLFDTFSDTGEVGSKVRLHIAGFIHRLSQAPVTASQGNLSEGHSVTDPMSSGTSVPSTKDRRAAEFAFLQEIVPIVGSDRATSLSSPQIARLRNIAVALGRSDNDESSIGPHDSNLVYQARRDFEFSEREVSALADAGLEAWSAENKPLWFWLSDRLDALPGWLTYTTTLGPDSRRIGAFRALTALKAALVEDEFVQVSKLQDLWFGASISDSVKNAALEYIGGTSRPELRRIAEHEFDRNSYATRKSALEAIIRSLGHTSARDAAKYAVESSFDVLNSSTMSLVLSGMKELGDDSLLVALEHRAGEVRAKAIEIMMSRGRLVDSQIRRFFGDASIQVRQAAVLAYDTMFHPLSDGEARDALVLKEVKSAFTSNPSFDYVGQLAFEQRKLTQLSRLSLNELREAAKNEPLDADDYYLASALGHFGEVAQEIRSDIDDRFKRRWKLYVENACREWSNIGGDKVAEMLSKNESFQRRRLTRHALDILISSADRNDLSRLRRALDEDAVDPRKADVDYLSRCGAWEDITRICKITTHHRIAGGIAPWLAGTSHTHHSAVAILKLAEDRLPELFELEMPPNIKSKVIAMMPMAAFRRLPRDLTEKLMSDKSDEVRKGTALQILQSFGRKAARSRLESYFRLSYRYYNVIFWMDLCEAWGRDVYRPIAQRELGTMA